MARLRQRLDENKITLNEDVRRAELNEDKCARKRGPRIASPARMKNRSVYRVTLDTVDKPNLQLIMYPGKIAAADKKVSPEAAGDADSDDADGDDGKDPALDPGRDEALNILADIVDLSQGPKTASTRP